VTTVSIFEEGDWMPSLLRDREGTLDGHSLSWLAAEDGHKHANCEGAPNPFVDRMRYVEGLVRKRRPAS
jgi:hypothetical protein